MWVYQAYSYELDTGGSYLSYLAIPRLFSEGTKLVTF